MFFASPALSAYAVQAPVQIVNAISEGNFIFEKGEILPNSIRKHIILLTDLINQIIPHVKELNVQDAKIILNSITPLLPELFKAQQDVEEMMKVPVYSQVMELFPPLFSAVKVVVGEVVYISRNREINEQSDCYNEFLVDLAMESLETKKNFGRKKLFDLFD